MSTPFYDLASLVLVPSGYKAQKVYAQKPLTTDGQLSFSRASTATRVNSAGLIETVSSNVPRLDYLGSTCPKLQLEPQRVNVTLYSEQMDNTSSWGYSGGLTVSANQIASPDGNTSADKVIVGTNQFGELRGNVTSSVAGTYTASVFAKKGDLNFICLQYSDGVSFARKWFDLVNGIAGTQLASGWTIANSKIENYGSGWYRCSISVTTTATTNNRIVCFPVTADNTFGGANGQYIFAWGAQVEAGAYATSYIPTTTAAVTRLEESAVKTGIGSLIGQQEGVIYWEGLIPQEGTGGPSNSSNMLNSARNINSNSGFSLQHIKINNSVNALFFVGNGTFTPKISLTAGSLPSGTYAKIAFAYKSGSSALYVNGVLAASSSTTFTSSTTISEININDLYVYYGYPASQSMKQMLLFKTRLTNAQLAELTAL